jgi:glycosyltransferase involved in cell wall biosynthesis
MSQSHQYVLVVTLDAESAPTVLFFAGLARTQPQTIRIAQYRRDPLWSLLGGASAVVFVRGLFEFGDVVECAGWLGIPRYYFVDDHFILIREQGGAAAAFAQDHSEQNVARMLRGFAGVLVSTAPLRDDFERRRLHPHLMLFPPTALPPATSGREPGPSTRIAFFGGSHLHGVLHRSIVPAIRQLARRRPVTLTMMGVGDSPAEFDGLDVVSHPYEPSYLAGVRKLANAGVDILVHPVAQGLSSNPYKNPHALITAHLLGATPVVSNATPYASLHDSGVAVLCDDTIDGWLNGLSSAADPETAAGIKQRLADHCRRDYDGAISAGVWQTILRAHAAPGAVTRMVRRSAAAAWLSANWVRRGMHRLGGVRPRNPLSGADERGAWTAMAQRIFAAHPSVATVSVVSRELARSFGYGATRGIEVLQTAAAALPVCFVNERILDLVGTGDRPSQIDAATRRGLQHAWIVADQGASRTTDLWPAAAPDSQVVIAALAVPDLDDEPGPISLGIDAEWLLGGESGAQVFVFEMVKAMTLNPALDQVVLLSDSGAVPPALRGIAKISGRSWEDAVAGGKQLDVLHRPYQPGVDTDFVRYRQVARAVAVTVLDFIAYDNPAYHESPFAFRAYQRAFDAKVCEADQVFAISGHIGRRLQRQFAHRLLAPVRPVLLGTDHLDASVQRTPPTVPTALGELTPKQYLAVLGNDFAHKNRDFAVKVFADLCDGGYQGRLVLAGFHLDAGSTFDDELENAGAHANRVLRVGSLSSTDKTWLLQNAAAVLYPTSSEGFGLIPFEAAALGTPTAFVRFGPLGETMPDVPAADGWRVREFADHVRGLLAEPAAFVAQVNAARQALTWERCAAETIAGYRQMLRHEATWHAALAERRAPGTMRLLNEAASEQWRRAGGRMRRLAGRRREDERQ